MTYEEMKKTIKNDYTSLAHTSSGGKSSRMSAFYKTFYEALKELDDSVGPFITSKEQFVEHILYIEDRLDKEVYAAILNYCKDKLGLEIKRG